MNISELRTKLFEEIQQVPEDKLMELYELIHSFRSSADAPSNDAKTILQFAGCWSDMLDETYTEFVDEMANRRQQAFNQRRDYEISLD